LLFEAWRGKSHQRFGVYLGENWIGVETGKKRHAIVWRSGVLECLLGRTAPVGGIHFDASQSSTLRDLIGYQSKRFIGMQTGRIVVVTDAFGHILVFKRGGGLVCIFFAFRWQIAGWMPDGTCFGPQSITGREETPGAMAIFGKA